MKTFFITILALLLFQFTKSQSVFVKGYMINETGDTLWGEVKTNPKKEHEAYNKFTFKDAMGAQKNCKPNKVKAYGFNGQHFVAMDSDGEQKYFQALARGEINFYKLMFETLHMNQTAYESEYYLSNSDNKLVVVKENKFRKQLTDWMKDNPEIANEYPDEKQFDADKAKEVIRHYNNTKANK